jgi:hypothetical protein
MVKHRNLEIRESETYPGVWVKANMQVYVKVINLYRELLKEEDENHDMIVRCTFFKGGWCYVGELMAECWEEQHNKNIKNRVYNNMKKQTTSGRNFGGGYIQIFNSESTCLEYGLTSYELRDIVEKSLKRNPTPKTKVRKDSVKDSVKREQVVKARKQAMAEGQEVGLRIPKNYEPYDSVPSINLGIKPKAHDEDNLEEE